MITGYGPEGDGEAFQQQGRAEERPRGRDFGKEESCSMNEAQQRKPGRRSHKNILPEGLLQAKAPSGQKNFEKGNWRFRLLEGWRRWVNAKEMSWEQWTLRSARA